MGEGAGRYRRAAHCAPARILAVLSLALAVLAGYSISASAPTATAAQTWIPAPGGAAGKDTSVTLTSGGLSRHYTIFAPNSPTASPGLLVFIHGFTRTGDALEQATSLDLTAGQRGHYIVYAYGIDGSWNLNGQCCDPAAPGGVDDLKYLDDVIASVRGIYPAIDANKVVVGGSSLGAQMAFYYSCYTRQPLAGVFSNDGNSISASCSQTPPQHVLAINGEADQRAGWAGPPPNPEGEMELYESKNGCGPGWTTTTDAAGNHHKVADLCRAGASIDQWVAPKLDHRWTNGPADEATYGIDSTKTVWDWILARWGTSSDPPPTAYTGVAPIFTLAPPPSAPAAPPPATITPLSAPAGSKGKDVRVTTKINGQTRSYVAFAPDVPAAKPGLIVMLHGENSLGRGFETTSNASVAIGSKGHYVVYPDALNKMWDAGPVCCGQSAKDGVDDVSFLDAVIGQVKAAHPAIGTRVAVAGFSGGGMMAFTYACNGRRPIAQVFSGNGMALSTCLRARTVRIETLNGQKDTTVKWQTKNDDPMFVTGTTTGIWATRSFSGVLGTWYWSSGVSPAKSLWQLEARGMRAGATHTEITAGKLDHRWTSKPADVTTYGVNVTAQLTSWLLPIWAA